MEVHSEHRALLKEHYLDRSIYFLMEIVSLCRFQHLARLVMYYFFLPQHKDLNKILQLVVELRL